MVSKLPVSPGQPSSVGMVFADSPGLLRENGYTRQFIVSPQTNNADMAICSGSADSGVTTYQPVLPVLGTGDTLNVFGIQAIAGSNTTPLTWRLNVSGNDEITRNLTVGSANRHGSWTEGYNLPIQIEGPAKVWLETLSSGAVPKTYNRIVLNLLEIRRSNIAGL